MCCGAVSGSKVVHYVTICQMKYGKFSNDFKIWIILVSKLCALRFRKRKKKLFFPCLFDVGQYLSCTKTIETGASFLINVSITGWSRADRRKLIVKVRSDDLFFLAQEDFLAIAEDDVQVKNSISFSGNWFMVAKIEFINKFLNKYTTMESPSFKPTFFLQSSFVY